MKVAIIGAGINGLYLAQRLAKKGEDVTVFEKREKVGKEVCSGLFSERILDFIPEAKDLIQSRIDSLLIHFPKKTIKIQFSRKFFLIDHSSLDNLAAAAAQKSGARIVFQKEIFVLPEGFDRVIGCDGSLSQTRKLLGCNNPDFYLGIQGFAERKETLDLIETWPTESGFIWKIPRADGTEYGIMERPKKAKKILDEFLKNNSIILYKIKSAIISRGLIIPFNKKITLCGDAAGLTKPWSGGGVVWGLIAADILLKNFPDFLRYKRDCGRFFLIKIVFSEIIRKLVYFLGFKFFWLLPKKIKIEGDFLI